MFVVELKFGPETERLALRPAHRDLLKQWHGEGLVHAAGPFEDGTGALLLINLDDENAVDDLLAKDPYYTAPGVTVVRRQEWNPLLG
ncbi:hypothetical protein FB566_2792 [Stackebrandtia endophytica]|uniref:YCII-related domain-containing protein n=1 Tax=Stackebrandtia endophytica TaxID=1496996 RepID=A0A543AXE4_9ACTN|nr:hypothetical protein FB566_2792 [Stackebrandtia endophytica]